MKHKTYCKIYKTYTVKHKTYTVKRYCIFYMFDFFMMNYIL